MAPDLRTFVALAVVIWAVAVGPARLVLRAAFRTTLGPGARRWAPAGQVGLGAGALAAVLIAGGTMGGDAAVTAAAGLLLLLLILMDLAWRWLPHEWTGALALLGLLSATFDGRVPDALAGAIIGGGSLFLLRAFWSWRRGVEAIGFGDVILVAGIGLFAGLNTISWILLGAALTGLIFEGIGRLRTTRSSQPRYGIAFGAHLCAVSAFVALVGVAG
ncbi:MAG: prepilin peptidase [Pseudomonadota bacterium]